MMQAVLDEAFQAEAEPLARIDLFVDGFSRMLMRQKMGTTPGCPLGDLAILSRLSRLFSRLPADQRGPAATALLFVVVAITVIAGTLLL